MIKTETQAYYGARIHLIDGSTLDLRESCEEVLSLIPPDPKRDILYDLGILHAIEVIEGWDGDFEGALEMHKPRLLALRKRLR